MYSVLSVFEPKSFVLFVIFVFEKKNKSVFSVRSEGEFYNHKPMSI